MKWIEEAAQQFVNKYWNWNGSVKEGARLTLINIIETCYNARSGKVSPDLSVIRGKLEAIRHRDMSEATRVMVEEALAMLPKEGETNG